MLMSLVANAQTTLEDTSVLAPVEVMAVRAADKTPVAKNNLSRAEIEKLNTGQDLPFVLQYLPSVVINSDAGNGFGYTGIRIRGTDATRINVTLNGIPYNDAESQGTFFVDIPDFASSAGSVQVQRGLGTSSIGTGSFGGSINISTNEINRKRETRILSTAGSYGSFRNSVLYNSGLFAKNFLIDARLSRISSDGYVDRASSELFAGQISTAFVSEKQSLRFNFISGKEKTYLAWNGIDQETLKTNRTFNPSGMEKPGTPYENETDNYWQHHYQLFYNRQLNKNWKLNTALFLTRGHGYYEQYRADATLSDYLLPDHTDGADTITETDLVRRLQLDNHYYGMLFSFHHQNAARTLIAGGGYTRYDGKHFGTVESALAHVKIPADHRWYNNNADKNELSAFIKWSERLGKKWETFSDVQLRVPTYSIRGFRDNPTLRQDHEWVFINPKVGISFIHNRYKAYFSAAFAEKEPNRDDFEAGVNEVPKPENMLDLELGYEFKSKQTLLGVNVYYMFYRDQLVLTGKINDVGAYTRTNTDKSYRAGIELQCAWMPSKKIRLEGNLTLSENKILNFTEYLDDYDNGGQVEKFYAKTTISYSPAVIGMAGVNWAPFNHAEIKLTGKYVGRQYLDNTTDKSRSLNPYYTQDVRLSYNIELKEKKALQLFVNLNNIFNKKYEANGYSFSYFYNEQLTTENYYFPMAPFNFLAGINVKL